MRDMSGGGENADAGGESVHSLSIRLKSVVQRASQNSCGEAEQ